MDNQPGSVIISPQPQSPTPVPEQQQSAPLIPPKPVNPKHAHIFLFTYLALIIIAASFAGYYAWHHRTAPKTIKQSVKSTTSHSNAPKSNLKAYSWTAEGLTFKYPSNWVMANPQLTAKQQKEQPLVSQSDPLAVVFSPNISIQSGFDAGSDPSQTTSFSGGFALNAEKDTTANITKSSDAGTSQAVYIQKVIPFTAPGYKQLWIIEEGETSNSYADELAVTDMPVKVGLATSSSDDSFQSKTTPTDRISFTVGFFGEAKYSQLNFGFINMQKNTFEQLPDYNAALSIIKSLTY